jgi:predicted transposase/invertase (TIGR01784 family)
VTKLEYTFINDALFKILFTKYPQLLMQFVAKSLGILPENIGQFVIINPDITPEFCGDKFCRLDINIRVNDDKVDLEIQVANEGDFPERVLYYWAREYSSALGEGEDYDLLPQTIVISILAFKLFDCAEYYSEFQVLETTRHTPLTDRLCLKFYELPKLPQVLDPNDEMKLWLALFNAKTEEDLARIEELEVPVMKQAIEAYRQVTATDEFKELERQRHYAALNRTSALNYARRKEREKWQVVVAEKDTLIAELQAKLEAGKDT